MIYIIQTTYIYINLNYICHIYQQLSTYPGSKVNKKRSPQTIKFSAKALVALETNEAVAL